MGIRTLSRVIYTTDTGREIELREMTSSHLLNAIAHHKKQLDAIAPRGSAPEGNIKAWVGHLEETVDMLMDELDRRHPDMEVEGD